MKLYFKEVMQSMRIISWNGSMWLWDTGTDNVIHYK